MIADRVPVGPGDRDTSFHRLPVSTDPHGGDIERIDIRLRAENFRLFLCNLCGADILLLSRDMDAVFFVQRLIQRTIPVKIKPHQSRAAGHLNIGGFNRNRNILQQTEPAQFIYLCPQRHSQHLGCFQICLHL